jgi:DNA-binding MarR family transcriptional regulator
LVTRQPSPYDRRVKHLVLTDAGRELRARMLDRVGHPPPGFERLTVAESRQLRDLMRKVLADE